MPPGRGPSRRGCLLDRNRDPAAHRGDAPHALGADAGGQVDNLARSVFLRYREALGETADELWENVCAGKSGISSIRRWDTSKYPVKIGGECLNFDVTKYGVDVREGKRLDRFGQFVKSWSAKMVSEAPACSNALQKKITKKQAI